MTISRTTSPVPIFRAAKDVYNHPLWNPSSRNLRNVEEDEAGRLRGFRARFGRGWDIDGGVGDGAKEEEEVDGGDDALEGRREGDGIGEGNGRGVDGRMGSGDLMDLITADVGLRDGRQVRTRKREEVEEEKAEEKGGKKKGRK
ncbi:MAG: hypothetical protein M1824_001061 [Vezdaea acicularis]|nr:MAG: hypothetical protein M1824_001061 [Vezdaea acicularis]